MPKTVIRSATTADLPSILALYRVLDEELVDLQPEFFCAAPREEEPIQQFIEAPDADFLLAEQEGTVVGLALVVYAGWTPAFSCVLPHRYASLHDLVAAQGPLPPNQVQAITLSLCQVLNYLHSQCPPVISRDVKPQNVVLDGDGCCHLIDLGAARRSARHAHRRDDQ